MPFDTRLKPKIDNFYCFPFLHLFFLLGEFNFFTRKIPYFMPVNVIESKKIFTYFWVFLLPRPFSKVINWIKFILFFLTFPKDNIHVQSASQIVSNIIHTYFLDFSVDCKKHCIIKNKKRRLNKSKKVQIIILIFDFYNFFLYWKI